ncbi:ceramidase domain-containing protein [Ruixingdingia sedimenti]|uniref:Ceramidase domain-containing protein n=1 Tax=Ruixingdingia sedimenti TaxID=3073604 RepID=A0ABU1F5D0_9RHOB|nr:ceramidase domain-containing protein [Xinfangfangia sp. LG-4]MDR5652068.1 ceramidase domain-containing protein [Xinfangfangia sp. LG-4]
MDWWAAVDGYCERTGPEYWSEPVNALTNLAFVLAALVMWRRVRGQGMPVAVALCAVLAVIGVGSWLFHTHANRATGLMDVLPIVVFVLIYIFAASRDILGMKGWQAGVAVVAFFPYAAATIPLFRLIPGIGSSAAYVPVPVLIVIYAALAARRHPATALNLFLGAAILAVSLTFRSLDMPVCGGFPLGTHFLWHLLNGLMLGWMIETYRRHLLASRAAGG